MPPTTLKASASALSNGSTGEKVDPDSREIEAIWKEVQSKVIQLANGDPKKVKTNIDINTVLGYLDDVAKSDKKKAQKYGTFKSVVHRTLQCISTVGGIVTSGVSEVFAPAGMCYNALTFAIEAWQGYEGIFENLAELLEKCVEFLERLESYEGRMDSKLSRLACQNLRLFVEICDRTIQLRSKHKRLFAFTKQLFLNDNGIQDLLGMMERLNAKESLLVNAQTYKIVSDSAGDLKLILDTQKEQKKEDDAKKWRRAIAKALGFPGTSLDVDGEPIPTWQKAFDSRMNALVNETGKWFLEDPISVKWTKAAHPGKPVFVLEGRSGSGKTSMMANALRSIRKMDQDRPTSRIVTAYYFAEGDKRKPDDEDTSTILETVSRTLLWQISTSYEAMTKSVAHAVERAPNFNGSLDLWHQLFLTNKERRNSDTTFYLFIDGFHEDLLPLLQRLSEVNENQKTRIFLTARSQEATDKLSRVAFTTVPISSRNSDDIDKYIYHRMNNMPTLTDERRRGIALWRSRILKELRKKCEGDYFALNTSLNALARVDLVEDFEKVLADAGKPRLEQIDAELRRLNNTRTLKEIQEINEIILWIETGQEWFSIDVMEAILSVKHRASSMMAGPVHTLATTRPASEQTIDAATPGTMTISLLPFAQKLMDKYPLFAVTDSGVIDWRSSEITDRVPKKGVEQHALFDVMSSSGAQVIHENEISIVKHFLTNVCPPDLYHRFEFEQFFNVKLGSKHKEYICLDPDNAHIKIALTCLVILTHKELRGNTSLRRYAMYWLLDHLKKVDLSAADRELKAQVGPFLVRLLTEECGIDSMFWPFDLNVSMKTWDLGEYHYLCEARGEWVYSTNGVQEVARWFRDSSVTKYISTEPGVSIVNAVKTPNTNLHESILSYAARHLATHLFRRVEFLPRHFLTACCFLRGYLSRLNPAKASKMPSDPAAYRDDNMFGLWEGRDFSLKQIQEIEEWAATVLEKSKDTPDEKSQWEIHGALITYQICFFEEDAKDIYQRRARKAIELNPRNWHACHFIAKQANTSTEEAVELLGRAKEALDDLRTEDPRWIRNHANSSVLARITLDLGDRLWGLGEDYALAARTQRESLQYDYVHFMSYGEVLARYQKRQQWDEFIAFIDALNTASEVWAAYFDELVNEFIHGLIVTDSDMLARAADATGRWDVIESFFTLADDLGSKQEAHDLLFLLRDAFARTLANAADNINENKVVRIRVAALNDIRDNPTDTLSRRAINGMAQQLAETYLDQAFRPGTTSEALDSYGSRLAELLPDPSDGQDAWRNCITVCCLIRYHHKRKTDSKLAQDWIRRIVRAGIELLSDDDEDNDEISYWFLARLLTTLEDKENTRITWTMRNLIRYRAQRNWEQWVASRNKAITADDKALRPGAQGGHNSDTTTEAATFTDWTPAMLHRESRRSHSRSPSTRSKDGGRRPERTQSTTSARDRTPTGKLPAPESSTPPAQPISRSEEPDEYDDGPQKPHWFVMCDGCDKQWTVMDEPLYTCSDCLGTQHFDAACHALLVKGELKTKKGGLKCRRDHSFIEIPMWDPSLVDGMPRGDVPLPDGPDRGGPWISLDNWKGNLRRLYLDG